MQNLQIALRSLWQHKRRTLLLGGAIAGVTGLLVFMLGLFGGIQATLLESATTLMTGHVNVGGFFKVTSGQGAPVVVKANELYEEVEKEVPELEYAVMRGRGWLRLVSETGSLQAGVAGVDVSKELGLKRVLQMKEGTVDGLKEPGTILLFDMQATKLGVHVGDVITLSAQTMRGVNNTADVRVVGVAQDMGLLSGFASFIPNVTLRNLYQMNDDTTGVLQLFLKDIRDVPKVEERLRKKLIDDGHEVMDNDPRAYWFKFDAVNREAWTGQKLDVTNWEDEVSFMNWTIKAIEILGRTLVLVLLVIIGVGVMNTLWIAIRERTREIGTLRAIGMKRRRVVLMFITESLALSIISTTIGAGIGLGLSALINAAHLHVPTSVQLFLMRNELQLAPNAGALINGVILVIACTTGAALYPSYRASRLKPVTAMQTAG